MNEMMEQRRKRAKEIKTHGTIRKAVEAGSLEQFQDISLSEAVVLGLINQGVKTFVGIFGHGMTDVGEVLRDVYKRQILARKLSMSIWTQSKIPCMPVHGILLWLYGFGPSICSRILEELTYLRRK